MTPARMAAAATTTHHRAALGLDLAHHREDMKPGAEGAGGLDRREQGVAAGGFIIEVNREQNVLVHVILTPTV